MGAPYNEKDAAKDTNSNLKEVSKVWHEARNDAAKEGGWGVPKDRHGDKKSPNSSFSSSDNSNYSDSSGKWPLVKELLSAVPFFIFWLYTFRMIFQKKKNPVCVIWWRDAAYSYEKELPKEVPPIQTTTGFIIVATNEFTNIAVNTNYNLNENTLWPIDGFVVPKRAIVKFKKIGWLI